MQKGYTCFKTTFLKVIILSIADLVLGIYGTVFFKSSSSMSMKITSNKNIDKTFYKLHKDTTSIRPSAWVCIMNERHLLDCIIRLLLHLNCLMLE